MIIPGRMDYFNPRSSCEKRPGIMDLAAASGISIHAPHTRSDPYRFVLAAFPWGISIHAPHARSDTSPFTASVGNSPFQSTLLMRGATKPSFLATPPSSISIHAPHARSDPKPMIVANLSNDFNPRSSCEERPEPFCKRSSKSYFNPRSSCEERRQVRV